MSNIIIAGDLFLDLIMSGFDFWPRPGEEAYAREFHREIGGAAITASGLAKLGWRTAALGVVGMDGGDWIIEQLKQRGVETSSIRCDPGEPAAFTVAIALPEDRAFLTYRGANRHLEAVIEQAVAERRLAGARHVHLAYTPELESATALFQNIRSNGCTVSLDVGWQEEWLGDPRALPLLSRLDIFFPNQPEAQRLTGAADPEQSLRRFADAGLHRVALKLGRQGAALLWDGQILHAAAYPVTPVDTTGAGDCFDAGFLHAWLSGEPPEVCLRAANICGALSSEGYGGLATFPTPERLKQELNKPPCGR